MEEVTDKESRLNDGAQRTYTTFLIAGESFAVDVELVKEVVKSTELVLLEEPFEDVKGSIELHSVRIPVLNTRKILKLEQTSDTQAIMIVNIDGYILGLMVDINADMEIFSSVSTPKPLKGPATFKEFVEGTLKVSDKITNVLALGSLVSPKSRARLFAGS